MNLIQVAFLSCPNATRDDAAHEIVFDASHRPIRVRMTGDGFTIYSVLGDHAVAPDRGEQSTYRSPPISPVTALRPLRILIRRQTKDDASALAGGIVGEYQTGDHAFDEQLFLGTICESETLRTVLNEQVRLAVLDLFRLSKWAVYLAEITIDDEMGNVSGRWQVEKKAGEADFNSEHAKALIGAFEQFKSGIPELASSGRRRVRSTVHTVVRVAHGVMLLGLPLTVFLLSNAPKDRRLDENSFLAGLLIATAIAMALLSLSYRYVRGHPDSADLRGRVLAISIWLSLEIGLLCAHYFL
ncbi:MAG: hypothetical protein IPK82_44055 [Polyangiaceae bacterium]|nr:hypothetical protein [Polyangiaceae bacterium]